MKRETKKAFTLAEVLISLTIIGVIAAITVPALVQRTNKQEYVSALQKTYSVLSQASNMIIAENGSPKADENGETWLKDTASLYEMYKKYLNNAEECGAEDCFNQLHKRLNNSGPVNYMNNQDRSALMSADGSRIYFQYVDNTCETNAYMPNFGSDKVCAVITADVNGAKLPNKAGRDTFFFVLKENGLYPAGCDAENLNDRCSLNNWGYGCACRVLREGAMNY